MMLGVRSWGASVPHPEIREVRVLERVVEIEFVDRIWMGGQAVDVMVLPRQTIFKNVAGCLVGVMPMQNKISFRELAELHEKFAATDFDAPVQGITNGLLVVLIRQAMLSFNPSKEERSAHQPPRG